MWCKYEKTQLSCSEWLLSTRRTLIQFGWYCFSTLHLCWNLLSCPLSLFFNSCSFCSLCCFSSSCSKRWFSIFLWCSRSSCWCFNARSSCCCCRRNTRITLAKTHPTGVKQANKQKVKNKFLIKSQMFSQTRFHPAEVSLNHIWSSLWVTVDGSIN